jgi:hypothetical protein
VLRARHENATVALGSASAKRRGVPEQAGRAEPVQARAARTPSPEPGVSKLLSHSVEGVAARLAAASRKRGQSQRPWNPAFAGGCRENPRRDRWIASKGGLRNRPRHARGMSVCPDAVAPSRPDTQLCERRAAFRRRLFPTASRRSRHDAVTAAVHASEHSGLELRFARNGAVSRVTSRRLPGATVRARVCARRTLASRMKAGGRRTLGRALPGRPGRTAWSPLSAAPAGRTCLALRIRAAGNQ